MNGKDRRGIFYNICLAAGAAAVVLLFLFGSEGENALFPGVSLLRLLMIISVPAALAVFRPFFRRSLGRTADFCFIILCVLLITVCADTLIFALISPGANRFVMALARGWPLLTFWVICSCAYFALSSKYRELYPDVPIRNAVLFSAVLMVTVLFFIGFCMAERFPRGWEILPPAFLTVLFIFAAAWSEGGSRRRDRFTALTAAALVFTLIRAVQIYMGRTVTPSGAYWGELADAFLHGHLYLDSPSAYHDLTFYNGHWYVPNPPLGALLLLPFALITGSGADLNMSIYSALIGAVNAGLIFLALREAVRKELFGLSESGIIWLTAAVVLGSDHFWLATTGQMWFIAQLLVVSFTVLSVLSELKGWAPLLTGAFLGAAVFSRPNVFPLFFCLAGVFLYRNGIGRSAGQLKKIFRHLFLCGLPVLCSGILLLFYNRLRFGSWLDFGYTTINGAADIVEAVQEYGTFNFHFLPLNLRVMITLLPRIDLSGIRYWFYPYTAGYSMLLMSPNLLYALRSFRRNLWTAGTWASVLVTVFLLLLYHNTGAEQFGYRYILDAAAPLMLLMGSGMKGRASLLFRLLTVFAAVQQLIGMYWWYLGRI